MMDGDRIGDNGSHPDEDWVRKADLLVPEATESLRRDGEAVTVRSIIWELVTLVKEAWKCGDVSFVRRAVIFAGEALRSNDMTARSSAGIGFFCKVAKGEDAMSVSGLTSLIAAEDLEILRPLFELHYSPEFNRQVGHGAKQ